MCYRDYLGIRQQYIGGFRIDRRNCKRWYNILKKNHLFTEKYRVSQFYTDIIIQGLK